MGYFVTVTYDLRYADSAAYKNIQRQLGDIDFSKVVTGRRNL